MLISNRGTEPSVLTVLHSANDTSLRGRIGAAMKYRLRLSGEKVASAWQRDADNLSVVVVRHPLARL